IVTQKWDLSCGAATLSIILTYYLGDPISEPEVIGEILKRADPARVRARKGFSLLDMKKFAETRGYAAEGYAQMTLADLTEYAPAIVPLNFNQGFDHFMVFLGIHGDRVLLADPAWGNRTMQFRRFEAAWRKIAFVVRRPGGAAQSSQLDVRPELFAVPNELAVQNTISRSALSVPLPRVQ
ncbi:MAG TPA: cysteine peptidase family C39 domain-containing protein, partial [Dongiaceae bacterium]|nr:cysteine peptidase family C39 domain-containing protein [Dongiaceae bacterium]